jgi:cellulose synthase/poly-beta-1,6-N-acetylglucosamine synthase-like glycosyltransferase
VVDLLHHHVLNLLQSTTIITLAMFLADFVLAFMWIAYQGFRMRPIRRKVFLQNLAKVVTKSNYPKLDVFICTADPDKEPPVSVVNTALSAMAYDYPTEKLSVYISDDGGSQLTLFAFVEAAKFAAHWLPYCSKNKIVERSPEAHFGSTHLVWFPETDQIKNMYEHMKMKVESVVERGSIPCDYITNEQHQPQSFSKWTANGFTRQDHPTVIQVIVESDKDKDKDITGHPMPNLIYVSREKNRAIPHNFKAGALNALLRVSAVMTNAPIILTLDCDMRSNDPQTPLRAMCYHLDPQMASRLAYVQFPQNFHNINRDDIYGAEFKYPFHIDPFGMDGLGGPDYEGTGCFFRRRAFFGGPSSFVPPENLELSPDRLVNGTIQSKEVLSLAHHVAGCTFEAQNIWGSKVGFRYGSLVEDLYTGYRLHCEGWRSIFCHPNRPAFMGDAPTTLNDMLNQTKRWTMGLLQVGLSKHSPIILGFKSLNPFHALCYTNYVYWPIWAIPITIYAFLPQLALLNSFSIFPKVSDPWFFTYAFLFLGTYTQDFLEFSLAGGTFWRWWNNQRMWIVRGLSSFTLGLGEYILQSFSFAKSGFHVTNKVVDDELGRRYDKGIFEFGVASSLFLPLTTAALINLLSFVRGIIHIFVYGGFEDLFLQIFIAGFGVVNCWPVYEAAFFRRDDGKMPMKITVISVVLASVLYLASSLAF